jgi:hypothetical protein
MFRRSSPEELASWQSNPLAARLSVPVEGAWGRLYAGEKRSAMLQNAFSTESMQNGDVFIIVGPRGSGKSTVALSVCDLRALEASYATTQRERSPQPPQAGRCVIVDPVSAFDAGEVRSLIQDYKGISPVILVDRHLRAMDKVIDDIHQAASVGDVTLVNLKLPSAEVIGDYIKQLLAGYDTSLEDDDYIQLGQAMENVSLPQVNQVAVDAALSRLQYAQTIDRPAFDEALTAWNRLRG